MMRLGSIVKEMLPQNKGNVLAITSSKFVSAHGFSAHDVLWQPFVLSLGGNVFLIGLLRFLWDIMSSWFQRLGGRVSDRVGRKATLLMASVIVIASLLLYIEAQTWKFPLFGNIIIPGLVLLFPAIMLFAIGFSFSDPAAQAIVAESVGVSERGKGYALFFTVLFLPALYTSILSGYLVDLFGFSFVWTTALILESFALIIALNFIKETLVGSIRMELRSLFAPLKSWVNIPRRLRIFSTVTVLDKMGWNLWIGVMFGMLIQTYHLTLFQIGILNATLFGTMAVFQMPIGRLVDKHGERAFLVLSEACLLLAIFSFIAFHGFAEFVISYFLVGMAGAMWLPAYGMYVTRRTEAIERGKIFGDMNAKRGILASPAPFIGSILFTLFGFAAPLMIGMFMIGAALVLLIVMKTK